jgi:hypothetical protein
VHLEQGQTLDKESKRIVETDDPSTEVDAGVRMREGSRKDHSPELSLTEDPEGVCPDCPSKSDEVLGVRMLKLEVLAEDVPLELPSRIVEPGGAFIIPSVDVLKLLAGGVKMTLPSLKVLAVSLVDGVAIVSPAVLVQSLLPGVKMTPPCVLVVSLPSGVRILPRPMPTKLLSRDRVSRDNPCVEAESPGMIESCDDSVTREPWTRLACSARVMRRSLS